MKQQAKDGLSQLLEKTPEDGRPKMKVEMKDMEEAYDVTPGSLLTGCRQGHLDVYTRFCSCRQCWASKCRGL
jgi:hypothetical protein